MDDWLDEYIIQLSKEEKPTVDPIKEALDTVQAQLGALQHQQETICEYLEKGIYTIDMFTKRNAALSREIKNLQNACRRTECPYLPEAPEIIFPND